MIQKTYAFLLLLLSFSCVCSATIPVAYKGRFIPEEVFLRFQPKEEIKTSEKELLEAYQRLKSQKVPPKEIEKILDTHFPIIDRLKEAGTWKVLPGRFKSGEWYSLQALKELVYDAETDSLVPFGNFTVYPDEDFNLIKKTFLEGKQKELHSYLEKAYATELAGQPYQEAFGKALYYPTLSQLKWEKFYDQVPLLKWAILLYGLATLAFGVRWKIDSSLWKRISYSLLGAAFFLHTIILLLRCYILARPPVSNMFETVIYVPWVSVGMSLILSRSSAKHPALLIGASFSSLILLVILWMTGMNGALENVQPVLDSQFWLIIHVLMVVGSYGVFILGGVLGHIYLISFLYHKGEKAQMHALGQSILQSLYLGTLLLISGTILGGVWAAQSWGRFWDWDPKESWAFISICVYLIIIHLYRFNKVRFFGLAVGAIVGLLAISFTWYGVNYILGTGLHSYGFGKGGQFYYYAYLLAEILFLGHVWRHSDKEIKLDKSV